MPGAVIRLRRNTSVEWELLNPVLDAGEQGFELDTGHYRIGDGHTRWNELDSFIPKAGIIELIDQYLGQGGTGSIDLVALNAHINSETPHPVYDNGPSLLVAYENAKV